MKWIDINEKPIVINGLGHIDKEKGEYYRLPLDVIDTISNGVSSLARCTASVRVRFKTNSKNLIIKYKNVGREPNPVLSINANNYAALYINNEFDNSCIKTDDKDPGYLFLEACQGHLVNEFNEIMIYLPMRDSIKEMSIGYDDDASIFEPREYKYPTQVVFYGSSIVQGLTGSHSGRSYVDQVCRRIDTQYLNLGMSGNCKAEENMAKYISSLNMSVFVYDYDHNAPDAEYLKNTHEKFFKIFREKQPLTPVIMMSKPNFFPWDKEEDNARREIIKTTYLNALNNGDKNVYFVDGEIFFGTGSDRYEYTSDSLHPNDAGFNKMADVVAPLLEKILKK